MVRHRRIVHELESGRVSMTNDMGLSIDMADATFVTGTVLICKWPGSCNQ